MFLSFNSGYSIQYLSQIGEAEVSDDEDCIAEANFRFRKSWNGNWDETLEVTRLFTDLFNLKDLIFE